MPLLGELDVLPLHNEFEHRDGAVRHELHADRPRYEFRELRLAEDTSCQT